MDLKLIKKILTTDVITISPDINASEAISIMRTNNISCILIVRDRKPVGIFTERDVVKALNRGVNFDNIKINELMSSPVTTTRDDNEIHEAYNLLSKHGIRHLTIIDSKNEVIGIVTQTDIINNLGPEHFVVFKDISKLMTRNVETLEMENTVKEAISTMADKSISCIIVNEDKRPVGILTERDIASLKHGEADLEALKVADIMSHPVNTIFKDVHIHNVVKIMNQKNIRRLIVVDKEGRLDGLITQSDVIRGLEPDYIKYLKSLVFEKNKTLMEKTMYLDNILSSATEYAIATTDLDFRITYYNRMSEKLFGYNSEYVVGKTVQEMHTMEKVSQERFEQAVENIRLTGEHRYNIEKKTDKGIQFIESRVSGIYDSNEKIIGYALFAREVTKQKQIEKELQQSHNRLHTILNGLDAMVYVSDMKTHEILFVNNYIRDIWGDVEGKICWQMFQSGQTGPCEFCTNKKLLTPNGKPGETYTWESRNTVTGRWYYNHDRAIQWIDGRIVRLEIATDITERKQAEEELKETTMKLEDKNENLEKFHKITVGRELDMIRLKEEVNMLLEKSGQPKKYDV